MITHLLEKTNTVLHFLGITRNTVTCPILCQAIELIDEDKNRLLAVEKQIYSPIADNHYCYPKAFNPLSVVLLEKPGKPSLNVYSSWPVIPSTKPLLPCRFWK